MEIFKERRAVPIVLRVIEHGRNRVGHVNDSARIAGDNEEEAVGRFEYQML